MNVPESRMRQLYMGSTHFIEKWNRARRVQFSQGDSGTVKVLCTILVLSSAHNCVHALVPGHLNTGCLLCKQQRELRPKCSEMEKGGERTFWVDISWSENCTSLALFIFSTKIFKICIFFLGHCRMSVQEKFKLLFQMACKIYDIKQPTFFFTQHLFLDFTFSSF
jgi:hypothetical protein